MYKLKKQGDMLSIVKSNDTDTDSDSDSDTDNTIVDYSFYGGSINALTLKNIIKNG
jgi:hypothetical protein